jgi:hypothetical protein
MAESGMRIDQASVEAIADASAARGDRRRRALWVVIAAVGLAFVLIATRTPLTALMP